MLWLLLHVVQRASKGPRPPQWGHSPRIRDGEVVCPKRLVGEDDRAVEVLVEEEEVTDSTLNVGIVLWRRRSNSAWRLP